MQGACPFRLALQALADERAGVVVDPFNPFRMVVAHGLDTECYGIGLREDKEGWICAGASAKRWVRNIRNEP